jgi:hypothetical protein
LFVVIFLNAQSELEAPRGVMQAKVSKNKRAVPEVAKAAPQRDICFVIMPFGGWLDDYYKSIYSPAIKSAGLEPHRADDLFRPSTIVNDIWAYTKRAKVLLADLTGKNQNVFYELGLAHALAKPAILVAETIEDIPFDLRALRIILYDKNDPNWGSVLQEKIVNSLREILASPAQAVLPAFLDVRSVGERPTVSREQKDLIEIKQELELLRREFRRVETRQRHDVDIEPGDAKALISAMFTTGAPSQVIIRQLDQLGVPLVWVRDRIKELENQRDQAKAALSKETALAPALEESKTDNN